MSDGVDPDKLRALRPLLADMVAQIQPDRLVALRADMDRVLAATRDAGYSEQQAGAIVMFQLADMDLDPMQQMMETLHPGWNRLIYLAVLMEVFDDAPDEVQR